MTHPVNPHKEITAALAAIPWAENIHWIAMNGGHVTIYFDQEWNTQEECRPAIRSHREADFWSNVNCESISSFSMLWFLRPIPSWPGDWRDSLHKVTHGPNGSTVEWVGSNGGKS